ncbi:hypothetical protein [Leptospira idonii]|uniref:Uncharacterized protein n=1 Tax=Leptospira idonii TaxID=1193500 RepID=A0A4R9M5W3_9LEPT|nr:hypothetical protein [Leptospira idonii]TGN20108.1 hypothetical protein EHS15_05275 [Leptospira idonii]
MNEKKSILSDPIFPKVIEAYQNSLKERYSAESLSRFPKYSSIKRETIDLLIGFFTEFLYPKYEERLKLDSAFQALAGFVHHPAKVWGILGNIAASIFRFGRHFPLALKAGLAALHSYVTAHSFEEILIREVNSEENPSLAISSNESFTKILGRIPQKDADAFRADIGKLFHTFTDEVLVNKIILIMDDILRKMETKENLYTETDKRGIDLGIQILKKGRFIFDRLSKQEMFLVIEAIDEVEREFFLEAKRKSKS